MTKSARNYAPGKNVLARLRKSDQEIADFLNETEFTPAHVVIEGIKLFMQLQRGQLETHNSKGSDPGILKDFEKLLQEHHRKIETSIEARVMSAISSLPASSEVGTAVESIIAQHHLEKDERVEESAATRTDHQSDEGVENASSIEDDQLRDTILGMFD